MPSPTTPLASLALVVLARLHASPTQRARGKLTAALARFAPDREADAAWRDQIARALAELTSAGLLGPGLAVKDVAPLRAWLGEDLERPWSQLVDLVWPARALGLDADGRRRLRTRDDWAAAIAARALGLWTTGPPPSPAAFCDLLAWRELGLRGAPKRLPAEVRALFLQRLLHTTSGAPERLLRLLAARELATPRTRA
ncbi:MAG TPA: hypothetical protein PKU97_25200, partial [Kofleriaceae bacterium]|nr:hypothetical protein [Kofleriaceae bacterium]